MAEINQNMNHIDLLNVLRKRANLNTQKEMTVKGMTLALKTVLERAADEIDDLEGSEDLVDRLLATAAGSVL